MGAQPLSAILLDTHSWAWSLKNDPQLSASARSHLQNADIVMISPISFFEIAQKCRLGKWPDMAHHAQRLHQLADDQGAHIAAITPRIATRAGLMEWHHRDPFDRFLAATANTLAIPILSIDKVFDGIAPRIW